MIMPTAHTYRSECHSKEDQTIGGGIVKIPGIQSFSLELKALALREREHHRLEAGQA